MLEGLRKEFGAAQAKSSSAAKDSVRTSLLSKCDTGEVGCGCWISDSVVKHDGTDGIFEEFALRFDVMLMRFRDKKAIK